MTSAMLNSSWFKTCFALVSALPAPPRPQQNHFKKNDITLPHWVIVKLPQTATWRTILVVFCLRNKNVLKLQSSINSVISQELVIYKDTYIKNKKNFKNYFNELWDNFFLIRFSTKFIRRAVLLESNFTTSRMTLAQTHLIYLLFL